MEIMENLPELAGKWVKLMEKTEIEEADKLYWDSIFPLAEKKFVSENKPDQEYDWLILPAGLETSYYIFLINSIKPKKVYFLGTEEFMDNFLDKIIEKTSLNPSQYVADTLSYEEMDVADVYSKIRKRLDLFANKKVVLDLTRGKRIMSVGAGIVGAFFGFDLVYVDEAWQDNIKRGIPGTEKLVSVKNPFEVFGDLEGREAKELFNYHNYGAALFFYKKLREKISDPREIEVEEILAESYLHWNSFNFHAALDKVRLCIKKADQYSIRLDSQIYKNLNALEILSSGNVDNPQELDDEFNLHIIMDLYANALRKAEVGMFEDAISRLYRVLELISQYRLRSYGIETSNPALDKHTEEYKKVAKEIYGFEKEAPFEIGLKDGHILLFTLKDYLLEGESIESLKKIFGVIRARDMSIIAHGLKLVGNKTFSNLKDLAKRFIMKICNELDENFSETLHQHSFIKLKL